MAIAIGTDLQKLLRRERRKSKIRQAGDYQSIYKFVSLDNKTSWNYLEQTIKQNKLIGNTNNRLNDPFEINPFRLNDLNKDSIADVHSYVGISEQMQVASQMAGSFSDVESYVEKAHRILDASIKAARIISFSDNVQSPLLWAHYANSHHGACLHFLGRAFDREATRNGFVRYSAQRPSLPLSLALKARLVRDVDMHDDYASRIQTELENAFYFIKPEEWSYEGEYRISYSSRKKTHVEFREGGLIEIIAGSRMTSEDRERIKDLIEDAEKGITTTETRLSQRTFSVEVDSNDG